MIKTVALYALSHGDLSTANGDLHLDNLVFESQTEPVFLDWSHPFKGAPVFNLVTLLFFMTPLKNFEKVLDCYLGEFSELFKSSLNRTHLEKQLGGELLRAFAISTCGVARWQPQSLRGVQLLEASLEQINEAVDFWQGYDPRLFSFLHSH